MTNDFDISTIEVDDTVDVILEHPKTKEPILVGGTEIADEDGGMTLVGGVPMSVTVYGPGSKQFKAAKSAQSNRNMKRARASGGRVETTADEEAGDVAAFLATITVSLNNFNYKGLPSDSRDTFRAMYLDRKMGWITDQVNGQAGDWGRFTKAAPSS